MSQSQGQGLECFEEQKEEGKGILTPLALLMAGDRVGALKGAQQAVHTNPQVSENFTSEC